MNRSRLTTNEMVKRAAAVIIKAAKNANQQVDLSPKR